MEKGAGRGEGREAGPRRQLAETGSWAGTVGGAVRDLVQEAGLKCGRQVTGSGGGSVGGALRKHAWGLVRPRRGLGENNLSCYCW